MNKHIFTAILFLSSVALSLQAQKPCVAGSIADGMVKINNYSIEKTEKNVVLSLDFVFDSLKVKSNSFMAFTPMLRGEKGEEYRCPSVLLAGRRQQIVFSREGMDDYPEAKLVRRNNGEAQTESYKTAFAFKDWMEGAEVIIREELCGCDNILDSAMALLPPMLMPVEPAFVQAFIRPPHVDIKQDTLARQAFLDFPVNETVIYPEYRKNPVELAKILASIDTIRNDKNLTITGISIHGYASPESPLSNNTRLANGRSQALKEFVRKEYSFSNDIFTVKATAEDWAGLRRFVAQSGYEKRSEMLAIIDSDLPEDPREWKLKTTFPKEYKEMLRDWYPALRHSDYKVTYIIKGFSLEEAREVFKTKPAQLSLEEMFLVAESYPVGSQEFRHVFDVAVRLYPNDPIANLNAANIAIEKRDMILAKSYLAKAGDAPEAVHARAVVAVFDGDYATAELLFTEAKSKGVAQAEANLALLQKIKKHGMKK